MQIRKNSTQSTAAERQACRSRMGEAEGEWIIIRPGTVSEVAANRPKLASVSPASPPWRRRSDGVDRAPERGDVAPSASRGPAASGITLEAAGTTELSERTALDGSSTVTETDIVIVGSGFGGLGMAIRLLQSGVRDFVVLERAGDVGGTWRDNTYPGCACDVQSHLYSFSFAPNPDWSRTFSPGWEIQEYLQRCAREYGVIPHL